MSQCCVCMEATGEKSVVRVALVHRGRGPAGRGPRLPIRVSDKPLVRSARAMEKPEPEDP